MLCGGCHQPIGSGTFVQAFDKSWHDTCFKCGRCQLPVRDAKFGAKDGRPYHTDCLALLMGDVCGRCHTPITGTVTNALGKSWHPDCFKCAKCALPISSAQFGAIDGQPYHAHCSPTEATAHTTPASIPTSTGAPKDVCAGCFREIDGGVVSNALNRKWHPECFKCVKCHKPIREDKFQTLDNKRPAHVDCQLGEDIKICHGCHQLIESGDITTAMDFVWHPECFKCYKCQNRIFSKDFTRDPTGLFPLHLHCSH